MHKYTVKVEAGELVGFFDYVTVVLNEKVDVQDYAFFETLQDVIDAGEDEAINEEAERLRWEEEGSEEYENQLEVGTTWSVTEVTYEGEVE